MIVLNQIDLIVVILTSIAGIATIGSFLYILVYRGVEKKMQEDVQKKQIGGVQQTKLEHKENSEQESKKVNIRAPSKNDQGQSIPELENIIYEKYKDDTYINGRFIKLVKHYNYLVQSKNLQYSRFQRILVVASVLTPITVGLEAIVVPSPILKLIALLLSLVVAILGSYLITFNLQTEWGAYRLIRESLISEFYQFDVGVDPYSTYADKTKDKMLFTTNVEALIEDANKSWSELHT